MSRGLGDVYKRQEHRETSPLVRASDAVLIDNGDMTVEEEVEEMLKIIRSKYESRN